MTASCRRAWPALLLLLLLPGPLRADDSLSVTGQVKLGGEVPLDRGSIGEDPSLAARVRVDDWRSNYHLHALIEGGLDGGVRPPRLASGLVKSLDAVYQDQSPYLEFKELTLTRSMGSLDLTAGLQRIAWGKLDEYPVNDLFNPWDYSEFLLKPVEERKIGVPALSAASQRGDWGWQAVWCPLFVPYRLAKPTERWSGLPLQSLLPTLHGAEIRPAEPDLPGRGLEDGSFGLRLQYLGEVAWTVSLFQGYDPRPVFRATALRVEEDRGKLVIDPGYVPDFHPITTLGLDADTVYGAWSVRAEAAYTVNRYFNLRPEEWGYPSTLALGTSPLKEIEAKSDTLDYGLAADYRPFEDGMLTLQAQQTLITDRPSTLYERRVETILLTSLKAGWLNQKVETTLTLSWNPEHGAGMVKAKASYTINDAWKTGVTFLALDGPPLSLFGRYGNNDQVGVELVRAW
jgi:hypothetical protein